MVIHSRFFWKLKKISILLKNKFYLFQSTFSLTLFFLFFGFIFGNFFGTFLFLFRYYVVWDGFIIFFLILSFEIINSFHYFKIYNKKIFFYTFPSFFYIKLCNYFKIGFLFGFFIDAFKVGS